MQLDWFKKNRLYVLAIAFGIVGVILLVAKPFSTSTKQVDLTALLEDARAGKIETLKVKGDTLNVKRTDGSTYSTHKEPKSSIFKIFQQAGIDPTTVPTEIEATGGGALSLIFVFLPIIVFMGLIFFIMRRSQGGGAGSGVMSFGKSRARSFTPTKQSITFSDVAGVDEAKQDLQEVVEFLKVPEKFVALGAHIPRGVLLVGPPGTGKTLLAKAVAGEAGVPFSSVSGSEFVEMFVGVGASRVRDLFEQAKRNAPCIIFVDEIDAVGRQRGAGMGGGNDEREQTLNQILVEMDGFDTNTQVIVIAATNRPDVLDPALLRPGRFDRQVIIDAPDVTGRAAILGIHAKGKPLGPDVSLETLAKRTFGFSGADLANLVNEAAITAARTNKKQIDMLQFAEAIDRVQLGPERKSRVRSASEHEMTAYHESGHALVAFELQEFDPLFKVTIVARGMAGGYTAVLPEEDRHLYTRSYLEKRLAMMLGGHVAEELVFGEVSTGASDDISKVTETARSMVTRFGMSEELGPRTFGRQDGSVFLGRQISEQRDYSESTAEEIDSVVSRVIGRAHEMARQILVSKRAKLNDLARKLIEVETLEGDELQAFMAAATA